MCAGFSLIHSGMEAVYYVRERASISQMGHGIFFTGCKKH